jgi:hypothetical protein
MAKVQPGKPDYGWFSLANSAAAFDVNRQTFHATYRPLVPPEAIKVDGRNTWIHLRRLIEAWSAKDRQIASGDVDAELYGGSDSPNLERLRAAKAALSEMDLEERRGTHADIRNLESGLMRFASIIRRTGEILQRRFGSEAIDILNDGIEQAESICKSEIARLASGDDSDIESSAVQPDK